MSRIKYRKRAWFLIKPHPHVRPSYLVLWNLVRHVLAEHSTHTWPAKQVKVSICPSLCGMIPTLLPVASSSLCCLLPLIYQLQWGGRYPQNMFFELFIEAWQKRTQILRTQLDAISQTVHIHVINTLIKKWNISPTPQIPPRDFSCLIPAQG